MNSFVRLKPSPLPTDTRSPVRIEIERAERALEHARRMADVFADRNIVRKRCKSLHGFIKEAWHVLEPGTPFVDGPHLHIICAVLEAITFGRLLDAGLRNRVIFNVPPGTMKSLLICVFWQAWEWGPCGLPHIRYLSSTYAEPYVKRDTRKTRDLIDSEWYQALYGEGSGWNNPVTFSRKGETSFASTAGGTRDGLPFGSLTSGRGDRTIVDDPQSTEEAESELERERDERIARESLQSRVNDPEKSAIVVIQQRLHESDTSGVLLSLGLGYIHVMLPMYFEPERRFELPELGIRDERKEDGELLMPARFPKSVLDVEAKALGAHGVATQWQQRPTPRGGGMFKRRDLPIKSALPAGTMKRVRAWDFAASEPKAGSRPDWTVGIRVAMNIQTRTFWIEKVSRFQAGPAAVHKSVRTTATQDGTGVRIRIPQDPAQAGKDQVATYMKELAGYPVVAKPISKDKALRAEPAAAQVEAGNVFILSSGDPVQDEWIEPFLAELEKFPRGTHDDQVDAFADAINELTLGTGYVMTAESIG